MAVRFSAVWRQRMTIRDCHVPEVQFILWPVAIRNPKRSFLYVSLKGKTVSYMSTVARYSNITWFKLHDSNYANFKIRDIFKLILNKFSRMINSWPRTRPSALMNNSKKQFSWNKANYEFNFVFEFFFIHSAVVFLSGICRPNSITLVVIKSKLDFRGVFSVMRSYTDLCRCGPRILISVPVNVTHNLKTYFMSVLIMTSL